MSSHATFSTCLLLLVLVETCSAFSGVALHPALRGTQHRNTPKTLTSLRQNVVAHRLRSPPKMVLDGSMPVEHVFQLASAAPAVAEIAFQKATLAFPTLPDTMTATGLYYLGQRAKGVISKAQPSWEVLMRWMIIGAADGFSSHQWYAFLEKNIGSVHMDHMSAVAAMTVATAVLFTPLYCAGFLGGLSLLEGKGLRGAGERMQRDFAGLCKATVSTWSIFNMGLFGCVELDQRVTVAMSMHFLYLIALALWTESTSSGAVQSASVANMQQEDFDDRNLAMAMAYHANDMPPLDGTSSEVPIV